MTYDPRPSNQRPGRVRSSVAGERFIGVVQVGPLRSTPVGIVLALLILVAFVSIVWTFFSGQVVAFLFWLVVEVGAAFGFLWDRSKNLPKQPPT